MTATILRGDARRLPLADESVDLVITSPPYTAAPWEPPCPKGWPIDPETGLREGPCGLIGCCSSPGPRPDSTTEHRPRIGEDS